MKGKKQCPAGHTVGCRASKCDQCTHIFYETESDKSEVDWKSLQRNDYIKSLVGYGPFYQPKDGEIVRTGNYGKFTVLGIDKDGILALDEDGCHCHLYMGPEKDSKVVGKLVAHKIIKIKKKKPKEV